MLERAFSIAVNGRPGAVFVEIPSDLADLTVEMPAYRPSLGRHRSRADAGRIAAAAALLAEASRPVLLAGSGAVFADAAVPIAQLAEALAMPVMTTPGGRGSYPDAGPLTLGQTGLYFTDAGKSWRNEADLVLSVDSGLEALSTNSWAFWPSNARFIQIDIQPETIATNMRPEVASVGDAALVLDDLIATLPVIDEPIRAERLARIEALNEAFRPSLEAAAADAASPLHVPRVLDAVNRLFGRDTILMKENGGADLWCYYWPHYRVLDIDDCVPMAEQTAMGMGVVGAIAAKLAKPEKKVVCFTGDGAMQMCPGELATAAEHKYGVTWIVLNNHAFGWVQYTRSLRRSPWLAPASPCRSTSPRSPRRRAAVASGSRRRQRSTRHWSRRSRRTSGAYQRWSTPKSSRITTTRTSSVSTAAAWITEHAAAERHRDAGRRLFGRPIG